MKGVEVALPAIVVLENSNIIGIQYRGGQICWGLGVFDQRQVALVGQKPALNLSNFHIGRADVHKVNRVFHNIAQVNLRTALYLKVIVDYAIGMLDHGYGHRDGRNIFKLELAVGCLQLQLFLVAAIQGSELDFYDSRRVAIGVGWNDGAPAKPTVDLPNNLPLGQVLEKHIRDRGIQPSGFKKAGKEGMGSGVCSKAGGQFYIGTRLKIGYKAPFFIRNNRRYSRSAVNQNFHAILEAEGVLEADDPGNGYGRLIREV